MPDSAFTNTVTVPLHILVFEYTVLTFLHSATGKQTKRVTNHTRTLVSSTRQSTRLQLLASQLANQLAFNCSPQHRPCSWLLLQSGLLICLLEDNRIFLVTLRRSAESPSACTTCPSVTQPLKLKCFRRSETFWSPTNTVLYSLVPCYIPEAPLTYVPEC